MIEARRLKNFVIFVETILSFVLSRKIKNRKAFLKLRNKGFLLYFFKYEGKVMLVGDMKPKYLYLDNN